MLFCEVEERSRIMTHFACGYYWGYPCSSPCLRRRVSAGYEGGGWCSWKTSAFSILLTRRTGCSMLYSPKTTPANRIVAQSLYSIWARPPCHLHISGIVSHSSLASLIHCWLWRGSSTSMILTLHLFGACRTAAIVPVCDPAVLSTSLTLVSAKYHRFFPGGRGSIIFASPLDMIRKKNLQSEGICSLGTLHYW